MAISKKPKVHATPRMSLAAMSEYIAASASRRRTILKEQKRPSTFQVVYYQPARDAICTFLTSTDRPEDALVSAIDSLYAKPASNEYEEHRWPNNALAIDSFLEFSADIDTADFDVRPSGTKSKKLAISGVEISVFPELSLAGNSSKTKNVVGGISLNFAKGDRVALDDDLAKYPTALIQQFLKETTAGKRVPPEACMVLDIFAQKSYSAPTASRRVMKDIEAACEEIVILWPHV